jgi:DNA-binding transcriptional ArsR family regulator
MRLTNGSHGAHYQTNRLNNREVSQMDPLSATFAALADPTRRAILARLAEGEATVAALAEPFDMTTQAVSKHLRVLEEAGLITRGRRAQWRPSRLREDALDDATDWLEHHRAAFRQRFDALDREIAALRRDEENDDGNH